MKSKIPVSRPVLGARSLAGATRAIVKGDISGLHGREIVDFESRFADFAGSAHAVACSSGTAALHLSLVALGIGPGDEVLVSDTTNMASFFSVIYTGATPIPIDIDPSSMTMDPKDLRKKITSKSKVIMPVHLFGQPCDMKEISKVASEFRLAIVEDCAEAHGALFESKPVGSIGTLGCFSMFANKILTTGEGGVITTDDRALAKELRALRSLNFGTGISRFMHRGVGFNYRMTNVQAALGIGQLKQARWLIDTRMKVEQTYRQIFSDRLEVSWQEAVSGSASPVTWMSHFAVPSERIRKDVMRSMEHAGIETRPGFVPYSLQDRQWASPTRKRYTNPIATDLAQRTLYLPTWSGMPIRLGKRIAETFLWALDEALG